MTYEFVQLVGRGTENLVLPMFVFKEQQLAEQIKREAQEAIEAKVRVVGGEGCGW